MSDTTYILVHGAWSAAWVWRDVGAELTRRDVKWTALDLPSSTHGAHPNTYLADDAREVIEIAKLDGPVVLVGHSYGGAVITEAAEQIPNLEGLIYVAALIPELGQSTTGVTRMVDAPTMLDAAIEADGDMLRLRPALAKEALFQDCTDDVADWAVSNSRRRPAPACVVPAAPSTSTYRRSTCDARSIRRSIQDSRNS